ncbi:MAG: hypothetical protein JWO19_1629 [Bryobacterales bacterium]|nr:hypothetical protein [Bryobacterales bacterium]
MMKKPAIDDMCIEGLQAAAASLTKSGASTSDIVSAFADVVIGLSESDRAYVHIQLDIVANLFSAGDALARMRIKALTPPKRARKKS